jgi:hypothetical protein
MATVVIVLVVSLGIFVYFYLQKQTIPDDKGFIPLIIEFENDISNVTLTPGSTATVNITLASNLDEEITVTLTPTLKALNSPTWFNATLQPNPIILKPYGTNATTLTIHLMEDTPLNIQPDALVLEPESTQYPSVRLWKASLQIYVKST